MAEPHASISGHPRYEPASRTPLQKTLVAPGGEGIGIKHLTRDQGGTATTLELGRAVLDALR